MTDRDPAAEAAQRATNGPVNGPVGAFALAAAREALAPIRELHRPTQNNIWCAHCEHAWPCKTARLIYPESEM